jgi:hypothetical protein
VPEYLAVKRLTRSDLTFFEWHFKRVQAGNQKAINLNADVFEARFYPAISSLAVGDAVSQKVGLHLLGPGHAGDLSLTRKIIKGSEYKNWRLNGEFIHDPEDVPERFHALKADDFVVLGFNGSGVAPDTVRADFVAVDVPEDKTLHDTIDAFMQGSSMRQLTGAELDEIVRASGIRLEHPIRSVSLAMVAEEGAMAPLPWRHRRRVPIVSREQIERAKQLHAEIGYHGESLVNRHLGRAKKAGRIVDFKWFSDVSAAGPYDFEVTMTKGTRLLDVKSTSLGFDRALHISGAELETMASGEAPYDIYRVYGLAGSKAEMRIAEDVGTLGATVLKAAGTFPKGVTLDSISLSPAVMKFGTKVTKLA